MAGVKGKSGRKPFEIEQALRQARESAKQKSYRIINDKLSAEHIDKTTIQIASNIVLKDMQTEKPSATFDQRSITVNTLDMGALKDSLEKIKQLTANVPSTDSKTVIDITCFNNREDDL